MLVLGLKLHYCFSLEFFFNRCYEELLPFHVYGFIILIP